MYGIYYLIVFEIYTFLFTSKIKDPVLYVLTT